MGGAARATSLDEAFRVIMCRRNAFVKCRRSIWAVSMIQSGISLDESLSCMDGDRKALCQELLIEQNLQD